MRQHHHSRTKTRRHGRAVVAALFAMSVGLLTTAGV